MQSVKNFFFAPSATKQTDQAPHSSVPLALPFAGMTDETVEEDMSVYINTNCIAVCTESVHNSVYARYHEGVLVCADP